MQFYGAFAAALSFIINYAKVDKGKSSLTQQTKLYRGIKLNNADVFYWMFTLILESPASWTEIFHHP